jgi:hypothetical protein
LANGGSMGVYSFGLLVNHYAGDYAGESANARRWSYRYVCYRMRWSVGVSDRVTTDG